MSFGNPIYRAFRPASERACERRGRLRDRSRLRPRVSTWAAYATAIAELKQAGELGPRCGCRTAPYLNDIIEQDHDSARSDYGKPRLPIGSRALVRSTPPNRTSAGRWSARLRWANICRIPARS